MKLINSILFYFIVSVAILMIFNSGSIEINIFGFCILFVEYIIIKKYDKEVIYDMLGVTWLQKKFKNNKLVMDMTKE